MTRIGLVSDTHGLLRPAVLEYLRGCAHILHAGDIGDGEVLRTLAALAPVTAVRGNNDWGPWAQALAERELVELAGLPVFVIHDAAQLRRVPPPPVARVVVAGHSHRPSVDDRGGVLHVNPGSAGPRRFRLPISAGELWIGGGGVEARLQEFPG